MTSIWSLFKKYIKKKSYITVVSGLPRSGTSMMMSALEAGGLPLFTDQIRKADANNPKGYYEFERVKKLPKGDFEWLKDARGKAVKVISALLTFLPKEYSYRVIFMERNLDEILASQARMLERIGKGDQHHVSEDELKRSYQEHLEEIHAWLNAQECIETLVVSYNNILRYPSDTLRQVAEFLDERVSVEAMTQVVDGTLYRERK